MPNEEIITALKNSVERGESLKTAMQIMINSGYNPQEVQAASKYIGEVPVNMQAKPEEQLTMPEKKSFFSRFKRRKIKPGIQQPFLENQPSQLPVITQRVSPKQEARQIRQQITEPKPVLPQIEISNQEKVPLTKQLNKLTPKKHSHVKEIMLLIILLVLIGLLITTILLKDTIMSWFS